MTTTTTKALQKPTMFSCIKPHGIDSKEKNPNCPLIDDKVDKALAALHTIEYYSALKRKETLTHATTWMNLEDIALSGISRSYKGKYCQVPLIRSPQSRQIHRDRECQGPGEGRGELRVMGTEFQFGKTRKFWMWIGVMFAQQCGCVPNATEQYT